MTFYKRFHLNPGVKLTLNLIYGGGMKGVKIEMSEAQAQNWEKTKGERGEKTELYHMYYNLFSSGIKKKTTPIVMMKSS